jgi:hypothetical protein
LALIACNRRRKAFAFAAARPCILVFETPSLPRDSGDDCQLDVPGHADALAITRHGVSDLGILDFTGDLRAELGGIKGGDSTDAGTFLNQSVKGFFDANAKRRGHSKTGNDNPIFFHEVNLKAVLEPA